MRITSRVATYHLEILLEKFNENSAGGVIWNVSNQLADTEDYGDRQKELEQYCRPFISKIYQDPR